MFPSRIVFNTVSTTYPTKLQSAQRSREIPTMLDASRASAFGTDLVGYPSESRTSLIASRANTRWIAQTRNNVSTLLIFASGQYFRFHCESTRKDQYVRATFCANVSDAFIAAGIVRRLGLEVQRCATARTTLIVGHEVVLPTSSFINVSHYQGSDHTNHVYRFYVVENCTFDILLGSRVSTPLVHWSAKGEKNTSVRPG
jgi:hypothetical protein